MEYSGPVPDDADGRLARRDTTPLGEGRIVRYQRIGLEKSPTKNYRWELAADGSFYVAWHSDDDERWQEPFDTDYPDEPTDTLPADVVDQLKALIAEDGFFEREPYQRGATARGGRLDVVTVRLDGPEHEVVFENADTPLLEAVTNLAWEYG